MKERIKQWFTKRKEKQRLKFGEWFFKLQREQTHRILKDVVIDITQIKISPHQNNE